MVAKGNYSSQEIPAEGSAGRSTGHAGNQGQQLRGRAAVLAGGGINLEEDTQPNKRVGVAEGGGGILIKI